LPMRFRFERIGCTSATFVMLIIVVDKSINSSHEWSVRCPDVRLVYEPMPFTTAGRHHDVSNRETSSSKVIPTMSCQRLDRLGTSSAAQPANAGGGLRWMRVQGKTEEGSCCRVLRRCKKVGRQARPA
jgi:hypothetical protein